MYETFKHFDSGNKGYITRDNLIFAFEMTGVIMEGEDEIANMFEQYDIDTNSKIDFEQFKKIILDPGETKGPDSSIYKRRIDRLSSVICKPSGDNQDRPSTSQRAKETILAMNRRMSLFTSIS